MENSKQWDSDKYAQDLIRRKARQLIGRCGFTEDDREDLEQEMIMDLLERQSKFDNRKGCGATFMCRIVDHKISTIIRHRRQQKRDYRRQVCSRDDPIPIEGRATITRGAGISQDEYDLRMGIHSRPAEERQDLCVDVSLVVSRLPPDLQHLAEKLKTHSITEVAREQGIPRSTLYSGGLAKLRRAFEDKGLKKYL